MPTLTPAPTAPPTLSPAITPEHAAQRLALLLNANNANHALFAATWDAVPVAVRAVLIREVLATTHDRTEALLTCAATDFDLDAATLATMRAGMAATLAAFDADHDGATQWTTLLRAAFDNMVEPSPFADYIDFLEGATMASDLAGSCFDAAAFDAEALRFTLSADVQAALAANV